MLLDGSCEPCGCSSHPGSHRSGQPGSRASAADASGRSTQGRPGSHPPAQDGLAWETVEVQVEERARWFRQAGGPGVQEGEPGCLWGGCGRRGGGGAVPLPTFPRQAQCPVTSLQRHPRGNGPPPRRRAQRLVRGVSGLWQGLYPRPAWPVGGRREQRDRQVSRWQAWAAGGAGQRRRQAAGSTPPRPPPLGPVPSGEAPPHASRTEGGRCAGRGELRRWAEAAQRLRVGGGRRLPPLLQLPGPT